MSAVFPALLVPFLLAGTSPRLVSRQQAAENPPSVREDSSLLLRSAFGDGTSAPAALAGVPCEPCAGPWDDDLLGSERVSFTDAGGGAIDSLSWRLNPLHDDAVVRDLVLPFSFPFYYSMYDTLAVGVNGFLSLQGSNLRSYVGARPTPFPCVLQPHATLAPFWADLVVGAGGIYFHATADSAVVEWHGLTDVGGQGPYTLQARLYPSGEIRFIWRALPAILPDEWIVGMGDARGLDGWTLASAPHAGEGLLIRRPANESPIAALEVRSPDFSLHRGATLTPEILLGNPAESERSSFLQATVTARADGTIYDLSPPDSVVIAGHGQEVARLNSWVPPRPGLYDLVATALPSSGIEPVSRSFLVHSTWDTSAVLAAFEGGQPADAYALEDAGEWAVRFDVADYLGLNASLVRVNFWGGWPDNEKQVVEVQLIGADADGAPDAAIEYSRAVVARGGNGFVAIPLPDSTTLLSDPVYVVIRQPLPFPDCESIAVDGEQDAGSFRRHWVRVCDSDTWQTVEKPALSGDLYVELYLSGSVGITGPDSAPGRSSDPGRAPRLLPPAPVPANPQVHIAVEVPVAVGDAEISVYNLAGAMVRRLQHGSLAAGRHEFVWSGTTARGAPVPSGVYWVRLRAGHTDDLRRLVILR